MTAYGIDRTPRPAAPFASRLWSGGLRAAQFSLLWWVLADGAVDSWPVAVPVVGLATLASLRLLPPVACSLWGIARFVPFFLWRSLAGGADVARRALHPRLPLSPRMYLYPWRLPPGLPRVFMANLISLLPGTLSTKVGTDGLLVHMLDGRKDFQGELEAVEQKVAALFGVSFFDNPQETVK